ncbi:hypothetical protein PSE10C_34800 [Pseudomonas amygdali pv. eriobotryae]|nr:hypothetical protein [Pseudomonas amygdali]KWS71769.1 hypothetical protein AL052_18000 [Pseudomonas amygdali pv. eriobotryae]GFZ72738.1 hypothetical protein PSE10C_34800 [Pseudomonas amygdali pv. eriobotryae]
MDVSELKLNYFRVESRAKRLMSALSAELEHLLAKEGVTLGVPIEARVKDWSSIEEKIIRKSLDLNSIEDLDDFVGMRLILLFRRDLVAVDKLIRAALNIKSSEDTSLRLKDTQFGYQSQHYVIEVPSAWLKIPSWGEFGDIRVEIQVRTLAQHIWAAASHKLQYKHEASVPLPLRRSINRASALLETVDLEFDRLLDERLLYVKNQMKHEDSDTPLNVEVVDSILSEIFPARNKGESESYDELLSDLNHFGINTAGELKRIMVKHMKAIMSEDERNAKLNKRMSNYFFKHVGLAREGLRCEFGAKEVTDYLKAEMKKQKKKVE